MSEVSRKIGNLDPKTNYVARVRAFNKLGVASEWSEAISFSTSDTTIEGAIPTVYAIAGARIILLQWDASANLAHDHYEINISTSANFTPNSNTLISSPKTGTIISINKFWNGTAFVELLVNQTYYIKMYDVDQSSNKVLMGTEVSATTGISINESGIQSQLIVADRIITGNLLADVTVSGSIKTGETGARLEFDADGLRGYAANGTTKNIEYKTIDGSLSVIGNVIATSGTFTGSISGGTIDIGGADATSFHVDAAGNMWMGNATYSGAPFTVSSTGSLAVTGGTITGTSITGTTITGSNIVVRDGSNVIRTQIGLLSNGSYGVEVNDASGTPIDVGATLFGVFSSHDHNTHVLNTGDTDLGVSVPVIIGPSGKALIMMSAVLIITATTAQPNPAVRINVNVDGGASPITNSPQLYFGMQQGVNNFVMIPTVADFSVATLTPGSHTLTAVGSEVFASTSSFVNDMTLAVIPL